MSTKDQFRPKVTKSEALKIIDEYYGIKGELKELPSERDRNYYIQTSSNEEYVLKISAFSEDEENLQLQIEALKHLEKKATGVKCPIVVASKSGKDMITVTDQEGNSYFVRLLVFLSGNVFADVNPHTSELLLDFGRALGSLSRALESFSNPSAHREFYWDLKQASKIIRTHKELLDNNEKVALIEYFLREFEMHVIPEIPKLRKSIIHNDANDYNVVVNRQSMMENYEIGILDFGDMVHSCTVFELAIATAYAILHKIDPITAAAEVIRGYNQKFKLTEVEIDVLYRSICTRLATSVCVSAYQKTLEPDNKYLTITEEHAWQILRILRDVHPRFATYTFRHACGLTPVPESKKVVSWLQANSDSIGEVVGIDLQLEPCVVFDVSVGSLDIGRLEELADMEVLNERIHEKIRETESIVAIGRYNETRLFYFGEQFMAQGELGPERRNVHLGIDMFLSPGSPVLAPLDGKIHSFQDNAQPFDYGSTIIMEHEIDDGLGFFTLYGHLSRESLNGLEVGKVVKKGEQIGQVGEMVVNGGWPPHLHLQIITDMMDKSGDFPGTARPSQRDVWLSISPDPNLILRIPNEIFPEEEMSSEDILSVRSDVICRSLSISYKKHLKIVRGYMQYLYDDNGRPYLDAVNNVPHVGHSHPKVVEALRRQAAVLNTNTRYLHENLVKYAKQLLAKFPEPLSVCFFVNSGSEANELALRLAHAHTGQRDMIVIDGAYHGNTGALVDISPYKYDGPGGKGPPPHVHKVKMPDIYRGEFKASDPKAGEKYAKEVKDIIDSIDGRGIAGFIAESLLGCGGQIVLPDTYLREVFKYIRQAGGVCIIDEVQVGFGRIGTHFWGFETQNIIPDIVTLGKPIGNGHPLAAVVTTREITDSFADEMEFFSTMGGNPVSCAVGMAVLEVIEEENLQENALKVGTHLLNGLKKLQEKYPIIGDVRGIGLFIGVELVLDRDNLTPATEEATYVINRMKDYGILISTDGPLRNVLKIKPPLVFTKENADFLVEILDKVLSEDFVSLSKGFKDPHEG